MSSPFRIHHADAGISKLSSATPEADLHTFGPDDQTQGRTRNYSISEAFSTHNNNSSFDIGGRSYVSMSYRPSLLANMNFPQVNSGAEVHEETADLANIGVLDGSDEDNVEDKPPQPVDIDQPAFNDPTPDESTTPLLGDSPSRYYGHQPSIDESEIGLGSPGDDYHRFTLNPTNSQSQSPTPEKQPQPSKLHHYLLQPFHFIPGVFLGTLLNILDGLSYGMIMFPIGDAIFAQVAPAGLSMFYMSCIVSQLVYSLGGSAFRAGIGSEMIEVTPFFHTMAGAIAKELADSSDDAIIATTIVSYAASSIVTGLVFFLLGKLRLGILVGFFPRHILVGCIGGVGYFLVATGVEVSSRLEGGLSYNFETFKYLFYDHITFLEWTVPLVLAAVLVVLQHRFHNSLLVPLYFIFVFIAFHLIVALVPQWSLNTARDAGWVFPLVEDNEPWYGFYSLYKFGLVDWVCILRQLPTMLALTFFGILHVPINVPALAVSVGIDDIDVDRELVAHGYSNAISGLVGSIQNYLVYTNSVLFIRAGADDRLAGVMLAIATAAVMMVGPVVIGYIPVCVVGALIYLLGYELLKEALYDTWGRLRRVEYTTIVIIVVTMGAVDFVAGIGVGILLACLSFVVEAGRTPVVEGIYTGSVARSTVMRHPKQQEFIKHVGDQIYVIKLQGSLFFGSIGGVEKVIKNLFEEEKFSVNPITYLIIDMKGVISLDFSAAEGFRRILNLANTFKTQLIISSVSETDDITQGLRDAGLFDNGANAPIELFSSLNYALEWCENSFLKTYKKLKRTEVSTHSQSKSVPASTSNRQPQFQSPSSFGARLFGRAGELGTTPRSSQVLQAASRTVYDEHKTQSKFESTKNSLFQKQPLSLMMITFQGLSNRDAEFWSKIAPYFIKEKIPENYEFYNTKNDEPAFFIVESGLIRSVIKFESEGRELHSSILPLVAFGDLDDASEYRQITYTTVTDSVVWKLSKAKLQEMLDKNGSGGQELYHELLEVEAKLIRGRFDTMTANLIIAG
ncbi:hypothetical protein Cantr_08906 [Candida viswanathii]|uniref:STAS domain-containing protein n=1 Tax=Candida viswanathii TaxID=5486 RepID=A0A367YD72_9ASCO|nr:hypothetical protein Cantr_08906 [Candida viswanathii]